VMNLRVSYMEQNNLTEWLLPSQGLSVLHGVSQRSGVDFGLETAGTVVALGSQRYEGFACP
jgi:hypothetical protein